MIQDVESEILSRSRHYFTRFDAMGRKLSSGDRFVIACYHALVVVFCCLMVPKPTKNIVHWAVDTCKHEIRIEEGLSNIG